MNSSSIPVPLSQRARQAGEQPISHLMAEALRRPELISLAAGFVDQATLPVDATQDVIAAVMDDGDAARAALQYGTTPGYLPLREALIGKFLADDPLLAGQPGIDVDSLLITAGSNQMLHLVAETLLDPGDIVLCASPTYFVFLGTLANLAAEPVGVAADDDGLIPAALEEALQRREAAGELARVKAIYVVSYFDNPRSVSMSAERRAEVVEVAKRFSRQGRIYVIEDAAYRELRYEGEDQPSLRAFDEQGDTVVATGTFSKSFSPGLRVGWGLLPRPLLQPVLSQKANIDFGSPNFAQHVMHRVLDRDLLTDHVQALRDTYRKKLQAMLRAADEHLAPLPDVHWRQPSGGLYVWLTLPSEIETGMQSPLFRAATEAGVIYVPGEFSYPDSAAGRNTIRLSFGVQSPQRIAEGIGALSRAIKTVSRA